MHNGTISHDTSLLNTLHYTESLHICAHAVPVIRGQLGRTCVFLLSSLKEPGLGANALKRHVSEK
jgi:hypothetical protein